MLKYADALKFDFGLQIMWQNANIFLMFSITVG